MFHEITDKNKGLQGLTVISWDFVALLLVLSLRPVNAGVKPRREAAPKQLRYDCR